MTPKTHSVCKHCGRPIKSGEYCRRHRNPEPVAETQRVCKYCQQLFDRHGDGNACIIGSTGFLRGTKFEPAAEPASTEEPDNGAITVTTGQEKLFNISIEGQEYKVERAARPSGPSAPQTSAEPCGHICREPKGDHKHAIVLPPIVRPSFQVEPDEEESAASQPVAGDAPKVEEIAAKYVDDPAWRERFLMHNARAALVEFALAARPYFPHASQTPPSEIEMSFRRYMWLNHGHDGLYGDVGQMQCARCMLDFKRSPLGTIYRKLSHLQMEKLATPASTARTGELQKRIEFLQGYGERRFDDAYNLFHKIHRIRTKFQDYCGAQGAISGDTKAMVEEAFHLLAEEIESEPFSAPGSVPQAPKMATCPECKAQNQLTIGAFNGRIGLVCGACSQWWSIGEIEHTPYFFGHAAASNGPNKLRRCEVAGCKYPVWHGVKCDEHARLMGVLQAGSPK